jgi:hypothetical protein
VSGIVDTVISVVQPARDAVLGFAAGDWVEISDEADAPRRAGHPRRARRCPGHRADGDGLERREAGPGHQYATTVRRWDSAGALPLSRDTWIDLEDGVQVSFEGDDAQTYRTGDYWLIPARSADVEGVATNVGGGIEWPTDRDTEQPKSQLRHGVEHRYCPIAMLDRLTTGGVPSWMSVADCRTRFPSLTDLTQLEYVGGDGQEAMPGAPLPQQLVVGVWNGGCAIKDAVVRFSTEDGGKLTGGGVSDTKVDVPVDDDGLAACTWLLDPDWSKPSQRTSATLLDDHGAPVGLPIDFSANLSIASQVAYDPEGCAALAGKVTVQRAVGHLAGASSLAIRCGDGQEALRGEPLPELVEVLVASACGPTAGARVEFAARTGSHASPRRTVTSTPRKRP